MLLLELHHRKITMSACFFYAVIFPFLKPLFQRLNLTSMNSASEQFFSKVIQEAVKKRKEGSTVGELPSIQLTVFCQPGIYWSGQRTISIGLLAQLHNFFGQNDQKICLFS